MTSSAHISYMPQSASAPDHPHTPGRSGGGKVLAGAVAIVMPIHMVIAVVEEIMVVIMVEVIMFKVLSKDVIVMFGTHNVETVIVLATS